MTLVSLQQHNNLYNLLLGWRNIGTICKHSKLIASCSLHAFKGFDLLIESRQKLVISRNANPDVSIATVLESCYWQRYSLHFEFFLWGSPHRKVLPLSQTTPPAFAWQPAVRLSKTTGNQKPLLSCFNVKMGHLFDQTNSLIVAFHPRLLVLTEEKNFSHPFPFNYITDISYQRPGSLKLSNLTPRSPCQNQRSIFNANHTFRSAPRMYNYFS